MDGQAGRLALALYQAGMRGVDAGIVVMLTVSVWVSFIYVQGRRVTAKNVAEQARWPVMEPGIRPSLILKSGRSAVRSCP